MTEDAPFELDRALFDRWRSAGLGPHVPDAVALAAYVERRLDPDEAAAVEAVLAADPALLDLVLELRGGIAEVAAPAGLIARAAALVQAPAGNVVPFRRRTMPPGGVRSVMTWGALAASFALVALVGFNLGVGMEQATRPAAAGVAVDLLDQGGGLG